MSASEKLKALDGTATPGAWVARVDGDGSYVQALGASTPGVNDTMPHSTADATLIAMLRNALPQIVAVIGAAEFYLRESTSGRPALTIGIEQSLAALNEALA